MTDYLDHARRELRQLQALGERALAQLRDEEWFTRLDPESNSIAIIMKHLAGNMRSRFTDFLTSDGEKPDRQRDQEFAIDTGGAASERAAEIRGQWNRGWRCVLDALEPLTEADLDRRVLIRGEPHRVLEAIQRQLCHYAYHVGQIVFIAKHLRSTGWSSLSIPRGESEEFNRKMREKFGRF